MANPGMNVEDFTQIGAFDNTTFLFGHKVMGGKVQGVNIPYNLFMGPQGPKGEDGQDFDEAPKNGKQYAREDGGWTEVVLPDTTVVPVVAKNSNYTLTIDDAGKDIFHDSGTAHTYTIPSNDNVAYPIGTVITFSNNGTGDLTIAIDDDVLSLVGSGSVGSKTLTQFGQATAHKKDDNLRFISGINLS